MAVYTEVSDEDLMAFVSQYDIGSVRFCKGIAEGIENSNYLLTTDLGPFILTLYEKRVKPEDLPYFLNLMEHLKAAGIPCPMPIKGRDGEALRSLCERPAAIVTFLDGMWPRRIKPEHCDKFGSAMARLHAASDGFPMHRHNDLSMPAWRALFEQTADQADTVRKGLRSDLEQEINYLQSVWPSGLPAGVIHADLFPDNVFFHQGDVSGIIDFYFACDDYFAYEIAICLNAWCFEVDLSFNVTKAKRLLNGYRKVREFNDAELKSLPILARGSAMRFLLTRLYDWLHTPDNALVTRKDPLEYLEKLRFHQGVQGPGAYGLD
ncbi:MAG: homoserine kinase [Rhodospirillaceae bacterium]|jgi:homoserine kinase type II